MVPTAIAIQAMFAPMSIPIHCRAQQLHATSVWMPKTATQEGKCPGGTEMSYSAANPVKDPI